jgi:hypothetical protein
VSKIIGLAFITFFLIGGYMIYDNLGTDFGEFDEGLEFTKETGKWLFGVGKATKNTVGYAIKQDWLPDINTTNETIVLEAK